MQKKKYPGLFAVLTALLTMWNAGGAEMIDMSKLVPADGKKDAAAAIQRVIDANPNRTLYFPDGIYLLSRPVCTPAAPDKSVHLKLARFAVFRAAPEWSHREAMLQLGGSHAANDIYHCGSLYGIEGGIIDGSGKAVGISIDSGRETVIRDCSLKNVQIGIHIKPGANSGSSDADIVQVNIVGNNAPGSIGVLIEGHDNTLSKMRIAAVRTGVCITGGGNCLRDIHPLQIGLNAAEYENTVGFDVRSVDNVLDFCYADNFAVGFSFTGNGSSTLTNCFCLWYASRGIRHTAIRASGKLESVFINFRAVFRTGTENVLLDAQPGGRGVLQNLIVRGPAAAMGPLKEYCR